MPTVLEIQPDKRNFPLYSVPKSDTVFEAQLAADLNTGLNVPAGARFCLVTAEEKLWYDEDAVITIPSNAAFLAGSAQLIESGRLIEITEGTAVLNFRSANQNRVTLAFYQ